MKHFKDDDPNVFGYAREVLPTITYLNLQKKELKTLPSWIRLAKNLEVLYLSDNQLTELPAWLGELTQLKRLFMAGNQLCACLLYTSPSPRDQRGSRMPSSA